MLYPDSGIEVCVHVIGKTAEIATAEARALSGGRVLEIWPLETT